MSLLKGGKLQQTNVESSKRGRKSRKKWTISQLGHKKEINRTETKKTSNLKKDLRPPRGIEPIVSSSG